MPNFYGEDLARWSKELLASVYATNKSILLYIEVEEGTSGGCVFVDEGNRLLHLPINRTLWSTIYDNWEALEDDKRWAVMQILVRSSGKLTASFRFPDEVDLSDPDIEGHRERAAAQEAFGDKPIRYLPLSANAFDLSDDRQGFDHPLG